MASTAASSTLSKEPPRQEGVIDDYETELKKRVISSFNDCCEGFDAFEVFAFDLECIVRELRKIVIWNVRVYSEEVLANFNDWCRLRDAKGIVYDALFADMNCSRELSDSERRFLSVIHRLAGFQSTYWETAVRLVRQYEQMQIDAKEKRGPNSISQIKRRYRDCQKLIAFTESRYPQIDGSEWADFPVLREKYLLDRYSQMRSQNAFQHYITDIRCIIDIQDAVFSLWEQVFRKAGARAMRAREREEKEVAGISLSIEIDALYKLNENWNFGKIMNCASKRLCPAPAATATADSDSDHDPDPC